MGIRDGAMEESSRELLLRVGGRSGQGRVRRCALLLSLGSSVGRRSKGGREEGVSSLVVVSCAALAVLVGAAGVAGAVVLLGLLVHGRRRLQKALWGGRATVVVVDAGVCAVRDAGGGQWSPGEEERSNDAKRGRKRRK